MKTGNLFPSFVCGQMELAIVFEGLTEWKIN